MLLVENATVYYQENRFKGKTLTVADSAWAAPPRQTAKAQVYHTGGSEGRVPRQSQRGRRPGGQTSSSEPLDEKPPTSYYTLLVSCFLCSDH